MDDFDVVAQVYDKIARIEIGYRNLESTPERLLARYH